MHGLLKYSNFSFASSIRTLSTPLPKTVSPPDDSDESTVDGDIGSCSGRIIYDLGEVALKAIEVLAIRTKLLIIAGFFPHKDHVRRRKVEMIYSNVLELSRPGLYHPRVRNQALRAVVVQIVMRQTHHLLQCLIEWPTNEIAILLSEILACMPRQWLPPNTDSTAMHRGLFNEIFARSRSPVDVAYSVLLFVRKLAEGNLSARQAVLDAGFLDVLLCMYACIFSTTENVANYAHRVDLLMPRVLMTDIYNAALVICRQLATVPNAPSAHPISVLLQWQLSSTVADRMNERMMIWRQLEKLGSPLVERRLVVLSNGNPSWPTTDWLIDICIDLVEFSNRVNLYGRDNTRNALELIRRYIMHASTHREAMCAALDGFSRADRQYIWNSLFLQFTSTDVARPDLQNAIVSLPAFADLPHQHQTSFPSSLIEFHRRMMLDYRGIHNISECDLCAQYNYSS